MHHYTLPLFVSFVEMRFHHDAHAGVELRSLGGSHASASQSAGIAGVSHCAWPRPHFCKILLPALSIFAFTETEAPVYPGGQQWFYLDGGMSGLSFLFIDL